MTDPVKIDVTTDMPLAEVERRLIFAALDRYGGDKPRAAESLHISLRTIYKKLAEYARYWPAEKSYEYHLQNKK